jgi:DNA modification methylase
MNPKNQKETPELQYIDLGHLQFLELRDIRPNVVEQIKERIEKTGYNPARPMRVVPRNSGYAVVDGNHRLKALKEASEYDSEHRVPCVVEDPDADVYALSHASNQDEDTYAQEDLWDHLDFIASLREDHAQADIAQRLGFSRTMVANHSMLLNEIVTEVLDLCRTRQTGRVTGEVTSVTFTEGWFRNSGLYDLNREGIDSWGDKHAQIRVMEWFLDEKAGDASNNQVKQKCDDLLEICQQLDTLSDTLDAGVEDTTREKLREEIISRGFTHETLARSIENTNASAKDRAVFGVDCLEQLKQLDADSVDVVVTDPPYGEDFSDIRDVGHPSFDDSASNSMELLKESLAELKRVTSANAHIYIFFSMTYYDTVLELASKHFDVEATPLIWAKNNHAPRKPDAHGFEKGYAQKYEPILFCRAENGEARPLRPQSGGVCPNLLEHALPSQDKRRHTTQKPESLLTELITNSSAVGETILDPFAGSGSTMLAAAKSDRNYIGFELDDAYESGFKRELREIKAGDQK